MMNVKGTLSPGEEKFSQFVEKSNYLLKMKKCTVESHASIHSMHFRIKLKTSYGNRKRRQVLIFSLLWVTSQTCVILFGLYILHYGEQTYFKKYTSLLYITYSLQLGVVTHLIVKRIDLQGKSLRQVNVINKSGLKISPEYACLWSDHFNLAKLFFFTKCYLHLRSNYHALTTIQDHFSRLEKQFSKPYLPYSLNSHDIFMKADQL